MSTWETQLHSVLAAKLATLSLSSAIALANDLRAKFRGHGPDGLEHTTNPDIYFLYPIAAADAEDLATLLTLTTELLGSYFDHEADAEQGSDWVFHAGPESGDHSVISIDPPVNLQEAITRLNDLQAKYDAHDNDDSAHGTFGSHQTEVAPAAAADLLPPVVWENTRHTPTTGTAYLKAFMLQAEPENVTLGPGGWQERTGLFQVDCIYPQGAGWGAAYTIADAICTLFTRGTVLTHASGLRVTVTKSWVGPSDIYDQSWYRVVVNVRYVTTHATA